MLERCYSKKYKEENKAYYGIATVCDEWKCFQRPNKSGLPNGVEKVSNEKYSATYNGKSLGKFNSVKEAEMVHYIAMKEAIKQVAEEYK